MDLTLVETLRDLSVTGSMTTSAVRLRVTQSAVSKRVAALERETGLRLVERAGRAVRLTAAGRSLLARLGPLVTGFADAVRAVRDESASSSGAAAPPVTVAVSESILASWGAAAIARAASASNVAVTLHAHRSVAAIDRVRGGSCDLAVVAGESDAAPDLVHRAWREEAMALVLAPGTAAGGDSPAAPRGRGAARGASALRRGTALDVWTIEEASATWRSLARRLPHFRRTSGIDLRPVARLESFSALVAVARAGFGHALVPLGSARAGLADGDPDPRDVVRLPHPGLRRPVAIVARKTALARRPAASFVAALASHAVAEV
ncbi:MAG: HTH-type transcriptional regulator ArgP [Planctomycetes bacterium]|nr:HTH-type transcriptional regulator ArgP [Planctomycetota bacterium]